MGPAVGPTSVITLVFNHHSLPFVDRDIANREAPNLIRIWVRAKKYGFSAIRIAPQLDSSWQSVLLATNYCWRDWLATEGRNPNNRNLASGLKSMLTSTPLIEPGEDMDSALKEVGIKPNGEALEALHAAECLSMPLLSHPTKDYWIGPSVQIYLRQFNDSGSITESTKELINLATLDSLESNRLALTSARDRILNSASDLWKNRDTLFPNVVMCGDMKSTLDSWKFGEIGLAFLRDTLDIMDRACQKWQESPDAISGVISCLSDFGLRCSGESEPTMQQFGGERRFRLPDGSSEYFWDHAKRSDLRIHFLPNPSGKIIYLGYFGKHLKTVRDPT
jgi:hypothetical protein